jgi:hypothetical protein
MDMDQLMRQQSHTSWCRGVEPTRSEEHLMANCDGFGFVGPRYVICTMICMDEYASADIP